MEGWDGKGNKFGAPSTPLCLQSSDSLTVTAPRSPQSTPREKRHKISQRRRSCRIPSRRARHGEMEEKKARGDRRAETFNVCLSAGLDPRGRAETVVVAARHAAAPVRAVSLLLLQDTLQAHGKGACQISPFGQACDRQIHDLPGDVEPWPSVQRSSKQTPRQQHCLFPSPVSRRVLHHHSHPPAMQPASEAAGLRVRGPAGGANTTGNGRNSSDNVQQNHQQGALRSLLGRNKTQPPTELGERKTIERHPSPCRSAIVVRKIASPSNTALGQGPELAGVLQCNGSTSHDSVIGHSPCKGCIQGTEHASSARRRPPASCARCDRLRPACRRRPLPLWCGWLGCRLFWRGGFISVFSLVGLVGLVLPRWFWVLLSVVFGLSSRTSCNRRRRRGS